MTIHFGQVNTTSRDRESLILSFDRWAHKGMAKTQAVDELGQTRLDALPAAVRLRVDTEVMCTPVQWSACYGEPAVDYGHVVGEITRVQ
jgi:hypothetical protein